MSSLRLALRLSMQESHQKKKSGEEKVQVTEVKKEMKKKRSKVKKKKRPLPIVVIDAKEKVVEKATTQKEKKKRSKRRKEVYPPMTPKLGSLQARRSFRDEEKRIDVVVIGGGVAGLSAAASILKHGKAAKYPVNVTILEARERLGGRVNTAVLQDKTRVDLGAAFVHGCNTTNPVYAIARKKNNVCVHTAHGGYSQGWFKGPWYDENGKLVTKEEWKDLEKLHEVIRGDLWSRAKELRQKSQDESIGKAFERYYALRAKEKDTPLMRRLMSSKNTLMWAYTAALNEISLTAAYDDDKKDRDSKVQHTCPHVKETSDKLNVPMDLSNLRKLFVEKEKSNVHRWYCLQSGKVLISGDNDDDTMTRHVQEKDHHLFISLSQLSCWCASCRVFLDIYAQDMTKILQCVSRLHVAKYGFELDIFKRDSFVLSDEDRKKMEEKEEEKRRKKKMEEEKKMNFWQRHASVREFHLHYSYRLEKIPMNHSLISLTNTYSNTSNTGTSRFETFDTTSGTREKTKEKIQKEAILRRFRELDTM